MGRWDYIGSERDELGANIGTLTRQVNELTDAADKLTGSNVDIPQVDTAFPPVFRRDTKRKGGVFVTLRFLIPTQTAALTIKMVRHADRDIALPQPAAFKRGKFSYTIDDIDGDEAQVGAVEREIAVRLEYGTLYDIFRLIAFTQQDRSDANPPQNPPDDVLPATPPLFQFTTPAAFGMPSDPATGLILANALDSSTRAFDAFTTLRQYAPLSDTGAVQTYAAANVNEVYFEINDPDGKSHKIGGVLNDTELTQVETAAGPNLNRGFFDRTLYKEIPGGVYSWVRNIAWANGQKTQSAGAAVNYNAGGFSTNPSTLTPSLSIVTNVDPYTPKFGRIDLTFTQPSTRVALKNVTVERKRTADLDSTYQVIVKKFSLKDDEYTTTGAHTVVIHEGVGFKPNVNYTLRTTIHAIGGAQFQFTQTVTTGTNPDVAADTGAPTLATNPDTGTTGPTVRERHSKIHAFCPAPSANSATLDNYQVVLSTQNTAPAGNPSAGSEGVQVILYGQDVTFHVAYGASLATDFYVYFRAHNQFNGGAYSAWSAGTNQHGYSRPIQDWIGTGVPVLPIRLESSGTAPGSPSIANDTTHFSISAADGADYAALLAAGVVLHLNVPALGASDTVRIVTAYDGTNHRFALGVAYAVTPGNSLAYEIHRGQKLGEKSGTGHSTTTINLGVAGAALASGTLTGFSIYMPSQPGADQIRKISSHSGTAVTLETATAAALASNACYMICQGSFGYAAINPLSGIIAGVPFRVWFNADTTENVIEVIMPTGDNAFSIQAIQILGYKSTNGVQRISFLGNVNVSPTYPQRAPSFTPIWKLRLQNLYRDGGSDGWSLYTMNVQGYSNGATPNYDPAAFVPVTIDFQGPSSYPQGRFPSYL